MRSNEPYMPHITDPDPPRPHMTREEIKAAVKALPQTTPEQSKEVRERLARQNPFHPKQQDEESRLEEQAWHKHRERQRGSPEPGSR